MNENQKILFIIAIVYVVGIFVPIIEVISLIQMPSIFGEATSHNSMAISMSIFDVLTNKDNRWLDYNKINSFSMITIAFITSLIAMPIFTIIIALTKQYSWLFTISFSFLMFIFSIIYSLTNVNPNIENMSMMVRLSWGWGLLIIPSLILLVMGIITLLKSNKDR